MKSMRFTIPNIPSIPFRHIANGIDDIVAFVFFFRSSSVFAWNVRSNVDRFSQYKLERNKSENIKNEQEEEQEEETENRGIELKAGINDI